MGWKDELQDILSPQEEETREILVLRLIANSMVKETITKGETTTVLS